ncbi:hypothetical protein QLX08_006114 [Tetragonisca angustula]|uniref:Protein NDUFAF4 homolog n=1 Tax=Tetragonisca angustula TaxID=166442 RepID=A0AAW0ZWH3_9HYME
MGKVYSYITRPIRSFNIENRTARILERKKPILAPQYPSVEKQKELVDKLKPDFKETMFKKDPELHDRLKNVFVQSKDPEITPTSHRPLPQDRSYYSLDEISKSIVPIKGKCTVNQIVEFITKHQENKTEYSIEKISQDYKIDKKTVENILQNFKLFHHLKGETPLMLDDKKKN